MSDFIPYNRDARYSWFKNLSSVLPDIAVQLALPQETADGYQVSYQAAVSKKKALQDAKKAYQMALADFNEQDKSFTDESRKLVKTIKSANGWNDVFAKATKTYKTHITLDIVNAQPKPKIKIVTGQVQIDFFKHGFDGVYIERKINEDEDFIFLASPQYSPFTDTDQLKTPGVAEVRYYRLTYIRYDQEVGMVSEVVWTGFAG